MTYKQAVDYVFRTCGNKKNNLQTVKAIALKAGLLPLDYPAVHIAGTNGKGTTAALLAAILTQSGIKTGLFTSPHLKTPLERIKINGKNISKQAFTAAVDFVKKIQTAPLNFFEILTLAALYIFKKNGVKAGVFECGIGGLLDTTNIINPALSIITSVDLDHCSLLGNTLKQIAAQKAGIIKSGIPVLTGRLKKTAADIVKAKIKRQKTVLLKGTKPINLKQDFKNMSSSFVLDNRQFKTNFTGLAQNGNTALAIKAAQFLGADVKTCQKVCRSFKMPCRFEVLSLGKNRFMIKDGAHNPAALKEFLVNYRKSKFYKKDNTLLFATSKSHNFKELCRIASRYFENIVLTCPEPLRNTPVQEMQPLFKGKKVSVLRDISGFSYKNYKNNIIVCGSFYLAALPLSRTE